MAGEFDQVIPGEIIESAWGNAIADRILNRYATATERDTKNPTPTDGDLAYLQNIDVVQVYQSGGWRAVLTAIGHQSGGASVESGQTLGFSDGTTAAAGTIGGSPSKMVGQYVTNMGWLLNATQGYFYNPGFGGGVRLGLDFGSNIGHLGRMWAGPMFVDNDWGYWTGTNPDTAPEPQPWTGGFNTGYGMVGSQGSFAQYLTYNWYRTNTGYHHINQGGNPGACMIRMLGDRITFGGDPAYAATGEPTAATAVFDASEYGTAFGTTSRSIRNIYAATSPPAGTGASGDIWISYGGTRGVWFRIGGAWQLCAN